MLNEQKILLSSFKIKPKNKVSWEDVSVSDKVTLRKAKLPKKFEELRITSGSTGEPLYVFYSIEAVRGFMRRAITSMKMSKVSSKNTVLNLFAYGNYIPGSMYERACNAMQIPVIPLGAPNTYSKEKIIDVIIKIKPDVWLSVPSYALALLDILAEGGNRTSFPKKVIVAGERILDIYVQKFKKYNIELINHFGLTECPAVGVSQGDPKKLHIINDGIFTEIVEENDEKFFVVTDYHNFATPIIRYKTGDVVDNVEYNKDGTVSAMKIVGRADDFVKVQGVLLSKTKIIESISKYTDTFVVYIKTRKSRDYVDIELPKKCQKFVETLDKELTLLKKRKYVFKDTVVVPTTTTNKHRHIVDLRK